MAFSSSGLEFSTKGLQSVCPTGIDSFDKIIGGGFALTSINIIEEDQYQMYSTMIIKTYLSSAIYSEQDILIFSSTINNNSYRFIRELPSFKKINYVNGYSPVKSKINADDNDDKMKIAFRYAANIPTLEKQEEKQYDFSEYIDSDLLEKNSINIKYYNNHNDILNVLNKKIMNEKNNNKNNVTKICRIFIDQLCSPFSTIKSNELIKFLLKLKLLMRQLTKSVCLISMANCCNNIDDYLRINCYFHCDSVLRFQAFNDNDDDDDDKNPYRYDYVGLLKLIRLPQLNSFAPYNINLSTLEFGIKLHSTKKFLSIEPLSLPPDLGETVNRFTTSNQAADKLINFCTNKTNDNNKNVDF